LAIDRALNNSDLHLNGIASGTIALDPTGFVIITATLLFAALIAGVVSAARGLRRSYGCAEAGIGVTLLR
jgi:hypothetical protein